MKAKTNIQNNLIFLAKSPGFSRTLLAKEIGVSKKVLASYLEGRASPKLETLIVIAERFELSLDDLIRSRLSLQYTFQTETIIQKQAKIDS